MSNLTVADLLANLEEKGLLLDLSQAKESACNTLSKEIDDDSPWHIKALIGFGAWLSSIFFFAFIAISGAIPNDKHSLLMTGILLLIIATFFRRSYSHVFHSQLALALLVTGYSFTLVCSSWIVRSLYTLPFVSTAVCLLLYFLNPDPIQRFLGPFTTLILWTIWIISELNHNFLNALIIVEMLAAYFLLTRSAAMFRPASYAFVFSIPTTLLLPITYSRIYTNWLPTSVFLCLGLVALVYWLSNNRLSLKEPPLLYAIVAIVLLACFAPPGLLAAIALLILGHGIHNSFVTAYGFLFIPVFIIYFYYYLGIDLAYKSWTLIFSGLVLLALRHYFSKKANQ